jgi:N-acetylglucosaminyl-diphospho-decaprenol L-rhamnosyltransferase
MTLNPPEVDLSVVIVNYNTAHLLDEMFSALSVALGSLSHQLLVIDNASRDTSVEHLKRRHPHVEVLANLENVGFGRANNQAIPHLRGRHVLLLNTDAFVAPNSITQSLLHLTQNPDVGILGVRLLSRDGSLQPSCRFFPTPLNVFLSRTGLSRLVPWVRAIDDMGWDHMTSRDCDWVPGCFYLMPRQVVEKVGLFDPRYFLYYEEVDHCKAVKAAGWRVRYFGPVSTVHVGGESAKSDATLTAQGRQISVLLTESELLYFRKHHGLLGLSLHLILTLTGDFYLAIKHLMKLRSLTLAASEFKNSAQVLRFCRLTRMGTVPTR